LNFLFVRQSFPGQFRHIAKTLAEQGHKVVALGDAANIANRPDIHPAVTVFGYQPRIIAPPGTHHYVRDFEGAVRRGQDVGRAALQIRQGFCTGRHHG